MPLLDLSPNELPSSRCLLWETHPDYSLRVVTLVVLDAITMLSMLVLVLVQLLSMLALAVVLSGYERRAMALLHHRDAPVAYLLLGLGQPIVDGGKLLMKSMSSMDS